MRRRDLLRIGGGVAASLALRRRAYAQFPVSAPLKKFIQPLPMPGGAIPVASPDRAAYSGVDYYEIEAGAYRQQLHPNLPPAGQRLYGYADITGGKQPPYRHLGGLVVARKGTPVRITFSMNSQANRLPPAHMLPFDPTVPMPGNGAGRQDRAAVHLHGGLVPWTSDGGPFHWFTPKNPDGTRGPAGASVIKWLHNRTGALTDDYWYPNEQSARLMWYHDHAIGITRLNAYAGLATGYLLWDDQEIALSNRGIPFIGLGAPNDVPLVIQDKTFWDPVQDPGYALYVPGVERGDIWYPYSYDQTLFGPASAPTPSCVPEFWADTMLVNGVVYPFLEVTPGVYRFRILNACNARFMNLRIVHEDPLQPGEDYHQGNQEAPADVDMWIIGTDGGFLPQPVMLSDPKKSGRVKPLLLGPAERADIVVDFRRCRGKDLILYNDAPAPFPNGNPVFDYRWTDKKQKNPANLPGYGPNTRTLMRFRVGLSGGQLTYSIPQEIESVRTLPVRVDGSTGARTLNLQALPGSEFRNYTYAGARELTLNEAMDEYGRLSQLVGCNVELDPGEGFGRAYLDPSTERVRYKTIEVWNIYNLTADTHPMHFHLFNVQVLSRRRFHAARFTGAPQWLGPARGPEAWESGWKETVLMHPEECTTVAVLIEDPLPGRKVRVPGVNPANSNAPTVWESELPFSPRIQAAEGIDRDEYVWHCHILEHEEHDMMRPLLAG